MCKQQTLLKYKLVVEEYEDLRREVILDFLRWLPHSPHSQ